MAHLIPIGVDVSLSAIGRKYGRFQIMPYASNRDGPPNIIFWKLLKKGQIEDFNDVLIFEVMPRPLLMMVCENTYEKETSPDAEKHKLTIPVVMEIDGEEWIFRMRAKEREWQEIHYEIEIEGEWHRLSETYLRDFVENEHLRIAERSVMSSADLVCGGTVFEEAE